jgi:NADPH-dependent curcumin reductase CurA
MQSNRRLVLVARPSGLPQDSDFELRGAPLPEFGEGEFMIRNHFASIDPAMRGWLDDRPSYLPPVAIGDAMRAGTVGRVLASKAPGIAVGDWVKGINALEDVSVGRTGDSNRRVDPARVSSMSHYISVAGGASLTAHVGINRILLPRRGETLLVSSAAGAVGSVAGQLGRLAGARVIGIAGGAEKCRRLVDRLGFDSAIDHRGKSEGALLAELREAAPNGLDMVFENVGGAGLDAALMHLAPHARIALCGLISEYNSPPVGARNLKELIFRSATMRGFTLLDFPDDIAPATDDLIDLANRGDIYCAEQIEDGLENAPRVLRMLFVGGTEGKLILRIA